VIIPRKIGAPGNPELAMGAVTEEGETFLDSSIVDSLGVDERYIEAQKRTEIEEIRRRMNVYLGGRSRPALSGRVVILVDDGIATGATMKAAVRSVRSQNPAEVVVAVPVAPPDTVESLKGIADSVVCLSTPYSFYAIGQFYLDFDQVSDAEVVSLLRRANP
jgi:putative phosphoribosyl transferase